MPVEQGEAKAYISGAGGRYRIEGLPAGACTVRFSAGAEGGGAGQVEFTVQLAEGQVMVRDITL